MYQGSVEDAKEYFDGMGYPCPANVNPADHYMDVIGGVVKESNEKFDPNVLFDAWTDHMSTKEINQKDGDVVTESIGNLEITSAPGNKFVNLLGGTKRATFSLKFNIYSEHIFNKMCLLL